MTILTHYHSDFISGHREFANPIVMGPKSKLESNKFNVDQHEDGTSIQLGAVKLQVIHTPGHTKESTCFLLIDSESKPACLFTGDTLFWGDVGRPDLAVSPDIKAENEAAVAFDSLNKIKALDGAIRVYPAHGNGSSCGKTIAVGNFCTI